MVALALRRMDVEALAGLRLPLDGVSVFNPPS